MRRYHLLTTIVMIFASAIASRAGSPETVGVQAMTALAPERGRMIDLTLWYPAGPGGVSELIGASKLFEGVQAQRGAPVADGAFPVVLLAHGGLRAAPNLGNWIAAGLAARGFIVMMTPAPAVNERSAQAAIREVWLRPADLSAALTAIERDPALSVHTEPEKVGAVGFLRGGTSALAVAGARLDAESYKQSCDDGRSGPDCSWFAKNEVDLHAADGEKIARSFLDRRIKVVFAVDPELSKNLAPASLRAITVPVGIISLGSPAATAPGLDASGLERLIPGARYDIVPDAAPFSSFGLCKPEGSSLLLAEGEDEMICRDGGDRSREEIHAEIAGMIETALRRGFSEEP